MADEITDITGLIGNTPMVRLAPMEPAGSGVELYGKLEQYNPGGSVKDRIALAMVLAAEKEGRIAPGRTTIIEATSGNTGIGLAFVAAARGYELTICLPQGMSRERETLLRLFGAKVEVVESMGGMTEAVDQARRLAEADDAWMPDQFANPANPAAHRKTTGPELLQAMDHRVDVFVAGIGTGGTISGVGHVLKAHDEKTLVVGVEPASSAVLSGNAPGPHRIQGIGAGFVPPVLDRRVVDEIIPITDEDAIDTAWMVSKRCGVLAGLSCGAAIHGAVQVAKRPESQGKRIAVILPDSGERYASMPFFQPR
ncbi:cysteine synthase A [Patulibacter sp.]|uniref:cysteine synthase A n=1 Tax=Patulibacter sp. TaxID=1912859 RepID=UPI002721726A|nr:cysteine synthase A [Patulibacter sp.]MDO9409976.1 cysteine synthase A [Patulibacter sp.]